MYKIVYAINFSQDLTYCSVYLPNFEIDYSAKKQKC